MASANESLYSAEISAADNEIDVVRGVT